MTRRRSTAYAPYGTCPECGWSGKDWSFKYQRHCSKCYRQWKKHQAAERRKDKPRNINVVLDNELTVTGNVEKRLRREAQSQIPVSVRQQIAELAQVLILLSGVALMVVSFYSDVHVLNTVVWCAMGAIAYIIFAAIDTKERKKRVLLVDAEVLRIAERRQQSIEDAEAFYASAEWRLLRKQAIDKFGRKCNRCKKLIEADVDVTVDHVLPRSKYPHLALDSSNLQILCRSCNSSKGNTVADEQT